jgi:hypothetical protein
MPPCEQDNGNWWVVLWFSPVFLYKPKLSASKLLQHLLHAAFFLGLFFDTKMEVMCSPKMSVDFQQTTQRYIPEDRTLHYNTSPQLFRQLAYCPNVNTLQTGRLMWGTWLLNVADRAPHMRLLGHVRLKHIIRCTGDMQTHNFCVV